MLAQRLDGAATEHARIQTNLETCIAYLNDCHAAYLQARRPSADSSPGLLRQDLRR
ncbi:hypothetical protein [Jatrophihabitans lederbergiae]|uniref:Uncharacterized protein n=1 Tax=Jatrophihabitans lederbergiae TaxID=3075547 RepID=A0ABU2JFT0_9ACTN|nr:hypothetical protein [Jatrophihabitans sp. DSM 44399]MDT0263593.1 hypothetical protein [Jatrophihabitans sp. DSM 44399]